MIVVTLLVVVVIACIWLRSRRRKSSEPSFAEGLFKPKKLLTENEMEFLLRLEKAAPELRFHAQVSMGALINPTASFYYERSEYFRVRGHFSQKIIDFVAQSRDDGRIIAVIELDDKTHNSEKDALRDNMLLQAGYKVVRWNSRSKPNTETIRSVLFG